MRIPFDKLFTIGADGSIPPKRIVSINGITMSPGVTFGGGVLFGGVDLATFRGKDLDFQEQNGIANIVGVFN